MSALVWPAETDAAELVSLGNAVAGVRAKVEVAWGQTTGGLFTFGTSQFGSATDLLAASSWSAAFDVPYADLSSRVLDADWSRGRESDLAEMRAGTATVHLNDPDGLLNRLNAASPLYAVLQDPTDQPLRITVYDAAGVPHPRFYGFLQTVEADLVGRGTATLTAIDFLSKLAAGRPQLAGLVGQTTGSIIAAILDWLAWTDPAMRSLDAGDAIPGTYTRADGVRLGLTLVSELLAAERGIVYVSGSGAVVYKSRVSRATGASLGTIDRTLRGFPVGTDGTEIVNAWTVNRTDMDDVVLGTRTSIDAASIQHHGRIDDTLETPFVATDDRALALAQYLVSRTKAGLQPVYAVPLVIPDAATLALALSRDLGDRVTLTIDPLSFAVLTGDYLIESIRETLSSVSRPRYSCAWTVSSPGAPPFQFGVSQFGGAALLGL